MNEFDKAYNKIINCIEEQAYFNTNNTVLPIDPSDFYEAIKYIEYFKDDDIINEEQKYFVQLPETLETLIEENENKIIKQELINSIFPELDLIPNKPKVYCAKFSFSDDESRNNFLNAILTFNNKWISYAFKLAINKDINGAYIDLRKIDQTKNMVFLLFNSDNYTRRTIYHEFTHYLQNIVGTKYLTILNANIKRNNKIKNKLAEFNMTIDAVNKIYFSDKEYVAQVDNLIYLIKEVWKINKDKYKTKIELLEKFFDEYSTDDPNILKSAFTNEIINVHKTFLNSIKFFIFAYICFNKSLFLDLKRELMEKFN